MTPTNIYDGTTYNNTEENFNNFQLLLAEILDLLLVKHDVLNTLGKIT